MSEGGATDGTAGGEGLAEARAARAEAEALLAAGRAAAAADAARRGIAALGDAYAPKGAEDDTGLKREAAEDALRRGRPKEAARLLLRVLESRLSLYLDRYPEASA